MLKSGIVYYVLESKIQTYMEKQGTNTFKDMCLHKNDIGCNEIVFAFIFSQMFKRLSVLLSI